MDNDTPTPRCANPACGHPFLPEQDAQKYCSARCREAAKKRRQRFRLRRGELPGPQGTSVMRDDPRQYSDFGELPDDFELAAGIDDEDQDDEQTARFHALVEEDAERKPRWSWSGLKQVYNRNPGVELPDITTERTERYRVEQAAIQRRLRNTPRQPQDRFNGVTNDVVATKGTESRRLNRRYATADPRPVPQQQFSFEAEQINGSFYRGGRPSGQRSRHSDYAWQMEDGFR